MPWTECSHEWSTPEARSLIPYPVYLGVTLDQMLSYREQLNSKNDLIAKLAGTSWGASASTLCTSALALCYSVTEYCCRQPTSLFNAPDFRLPAIHAALMTASAQQCCTSFSTSWSGNWQYASNHRNPSKLACESWCFWASTSTACISTPNMVRHDICRHNHTVERGLVVSFRG